jgi:hypothetical protein
MICDNFGSRSSCLNDVVRRWKVRLTCTESNNWAASGFKRFRLGIYS